jgi:hypothetical protein
VHGTVGALLETCTEPKAAHNPIVVSRSSAVAPMTAVLKICLQGQPTCCLLLCPDGSQWLTASPSHVLGRSFVLRPAPTLYKRLGVSFRKRRLEVTYKPCEGAKLTPIHSVYLMCVNKTNITNMSKR